MKPHHQDDERAVWHVRIDTLPRAVVEHRFNDKTWTGHYEDTGKLLEDYELRAVVELGDLAGC